MCFAQKNGSISGFIKDSLSNKNLALATIGVYSATDSSLLKFRMSDEEGKFSIQNLDLNILYRVIVTFSGYTVGRIECVLTNDSPKLNLGTIRLSSNSGLLEEVLVFAERPPIIVRNDTIEFNANSFKTFPNALLEDLLKKLPGVSVDKSGMIKVNGARVNKIKVNGKAFFGNDYSIASRNLPANIIDKVQVMDDKDAKQDVFTSDGQIEKVINLTFKTGINKGLFGNLNAGGGTDTRYKLGGLLNAFRDTSQLSLLGLSDNLNQFGINSGGLSFENGFGRYGSNFGDVSLSAQSEREQLNGLNNIAAVGVNFNTAQIKNTDINLVYLITSAKNNKATFVDREQFLDNGTLGSNSVVDQHTSEKNQIIKTSINWKPGSQSRFTLKPSLIFKEREIESTAESSTLHSIDGILNESSNKQNSLSQSTVFQNDFSYSWKSRKSGRNLYFSNWIVHTNDKSNQFNYAENSFYSLSPYTSTLDQLRVSRLPSLRVHTSWSFEEHFSDKLSVQLSQVHKFVQNKNDIATFLNNGNNNDYQNLVDSLSNLMDRSLRGITNKVGFKYLSASGLRISSHFSHHWTRINNKFDKYPSLEQKFNYILPQIELNWKAFRISYIKNFKELDATLIQPIPNNTNPLYIQLGNPDLKPSIDHKYNFMLVKHSIKRQLFYQIGINSAFTEHAIIFERTISNDGVQTTKAVNAGTILSGGLNVSASKQYKYENNWILSMEASTNILYMRNAIILNNISAQQNVFNLNPHFAYLFNWKGKVEFGQSYEPEIMTGRAVNTHFPNINTVNHAVRTDIMFALVKDFIMESSLSYNYYTNVSPDMPNSTLIWNAALQYLFLKDKKATLKLSGNDLLNQNRIVSRVVSENSVINRSTNTLQRYLILSFVYNIRDFKVQKKGGRGSLFPF